MQRFIVGLVAVLGLGVGLSLARGGEEKDKEKEPQGVASYISKTDLKWEKLVPDLGEDSPETAVVHADAKMTQLFIRAKKKFHVPRHWHSVDESVTVIKGTFTITCDRCGKQVTQGPGELAYLPAKCIHQAWTSEDSMVFVTANGPFDLNWVEKPSAKDVGVDPPKVDDGTR